MTAHELARRLLEGPDVRVELHVSGVDQETGRWGSWFGDVHELLANKNSVDLHAAIEANGEEEDDGD